ncbi:MAG: HAD-IA family hydrolase [Planctomycetota bacterium]
MDLRAIFFDFGNTLAREVPTRFEIYAEAARRRGCDVDERAMAQLMGAAHEALPLRVDGGFRYSDAWFGAFIERIFGGALGLPAADVAEVRRELFRRFEDASTFEVFAGARELLRDLRDAGLTLGLVSNWSARLPRLLAALELERSFDFVLCSAIEEVEKPDPAIFERALERAGHAAETCLHVGDQPENDGAAAKVGIDVLFVDHENVLEHAGHARVLSLPAVGTHVLGARFDR